MNGHWSNSKSIGTSRFRMAKQEFSVNRGLNLKRNAELPVT